MYQRYAQEKVETALQDTPAVVVVGPRQCGKTTLIKSFASDQSWSYVTLDDLNQLQFAQVDPVGFVRSFGARHVIIDEIQRVPELMLPLKQAIDEDRQPGRYLLSGSANAMALPKVADSLAGRLEVVNLYPLSQSEVLGKPSSFLTRLLAGELPMTTCTRLRDELVQQICKGGFPEVLARGSEARRMAWFQQYMMSLVQKDLVDIADIEHLALMPKLIHMLSNQAAQLMNYSQISEALQIPRQTVKRYMELLKQLFVFQELTAWHGNENKRLVKTPKIHMIDTGLACGVRRINTARLTEDRTLFGHLLENYVFCELQKIASWSEEQFYFYHYRDKDKVEVDIVIETAMGDVIAIEVKSGATITSADFKGLERLRDVVGDRFKMGVLLYDGDHSNQLPDRICSAPLGVIWE